LNDPSAAMTREYLINGDLISGFKLQFYRIRSFSFIRIKPHPFL